MKNEIIKSWNQVSIEKYINLYNLYKNESDEIEILFKRLGILLDLTYEEVNDLPLSEYNDIKENLDFLNKEPNQSNYKQTFEIDGITFTLKEFNKFKLGEWVDMEYYQKDFINNLHRIINILYTNSENKDMSELLFKKMDIESAMGVFFFLYLFALDFTPSHIQDCSQLEIAIQGMNKLKNQLDQELLQK